jgi:hypothetical protein
MIQILPRTVVVACILATAGIAHSQTGTQSDGAMASVRVDCGAFRKNMDGSWVTTKDTTVYAGLNDATRQYARLVNRQPSRARHVPPSRSIACPL